jgi:FixJ family two-component response regulator
VTVVGDDVSVREALPDRLKQFGFAAGAFSSLEGFLSSGCVDQTRCLVLDLSMPGMTGLDLQPELKLLGAGDSDHLHQRSKGRRRPAASP